MSASRTATVGEEMTRLTAPSALAAQIGGEAPQELRAAFDSLFEQWSKDTVVTSSATKVISHRAYQNVIGMGKPMVGFILEKIEDGHFHWCWALCEITGQDPAKEAESLEAAAKVWTKWGKENGYLTA